MSGSSKERHHHDIRQDLDDYSDLDHGNRKAAGSQLGAIFFGFTAAAVLFVLLLLDPFAWHGIDEALRGEATPADGMDTAAEAAAPELWTCPMHPEILQEEAGACPICGMDLVPSTESGSIARASSDHGGHEHGSYEHDSHDHGSGDHGSHGSGAQETIYSCGMHPDIVETEPGSCPICGMDLTAVSSAPPMVAAAEPTSAHVCPMHPEIVQEEAGACPICGMDLVPTEVEGAADDGEESPAVHLDPVVIQRMNVQVATVERRDILRNIRTVGYLDYDQQRMVTVTPKYEGWVEAVHVNYVGEPVKKGQPLFEIYSPELVRTQEELLSAVRYAEQLGDITTDAPGDAKRRAADLVRAARQRLGYWDVPESRLDRLVERGEVFRTLTVHAPASGVVMERQPGLEGKAVKPGDELFHIADLSSLWLSVEVFEDQLAWIAPGAVAQVRLSYFPGETFRGRVRFVEPELSESTRTLSLRLEVPNEDGRLRAGMYATVVFDPPAAAAAVTVPQQAVLRTGERDLVVVALGEGTFAPRQVQLGHEGGGQVQILEGLEPGERIVISAQFLIDSESNLRAAIQKLLAERRSRSVRMEAGDGSDGMAAGAGHAH